MIKEIIIVIFILLAINIINAKADDHEHGQDGLPDWYDPNCCNKRDCKPVEDEDIELEGEFSDEE